MRRLRSRGWQPVITAYTGYGAPGWARVMARVVLTRPPKFRKKLDKVRGWRSFTSSPVHNEVVRIQMGDGVTETRTDRSGYVDCVVKGELEPGWGSVRLTADGAAPVEAPIRVVDPACRFGLISDIDDTVMVTALPRPLLAAWNTFVLDEHARMAVPGMAVLYERLVTANPGAPVFYLSTGAWNVAPTLTRFLSRHLYPAGPLLLTDWGPTPDRWFRSGQEHKRHTLRRLAERVPGRPLAADRRRRPARPGDLLRVRARPTRKTSPPWRSAGSRRPRPCWPAPSRDRPARPRRSARAARPGSPRPTGPGCGRYSVTPMSSDPGSPVASASRWCRRSRTSLGRVRPAPALGSGHDHTRSPRRPPARPVPLPSTNASAEDRHVVTRHQPRPGHRPDAYG